MATCFRNFTREQRQNGDSILYKDLVSQYGEKEAEYLYENIIHSDRIDNKGNFRTFFYNRNSTENGELENLDENDEPLLSEVKSWINYKNTYNRINKVFSTNEIETTPNEFINLAEGFSYHLVNTIFTDKNLTPEELIEMNRKDTKNILNTTFNKFLTNLDESINDAIKNELLDSDEIERLMLIKEKIEQNRNLFYKSINNYLKSKFNLSINLENVLSDDIESKEDKVYKDSAFNKNSFEFDTKDGAPSSIKLLIGTLPAVEIKDNKPVIIKNEMGLPTLVDYNDTFNFIQQKLLDVDNDIDAILTKLKLESARKPELTELIDRLNFKNSIYNPSSNTLKLITETQLRTQFVNQFNKFKAEFRLHIIQPDGSIKVINANHDNVKNKIINEWRSAFEIKLANNPNLVNFAKLKDIDKSSTLILDFLGISNVQFNKKIPDSLINRIRDYGLNNVENARNIFQGNVKGAIKELASLVINEDTIDFQLNNSENKIVYAITLNSFLSTTANKLRMYKGNEKALRDAFPELFNSHYSKNSILLNEIVNGANLKFGIYDGFKSEDNLQTGTSSKDLKPKDLLLQRISGIINHGYYPFLRTADRGVEYYLELESKNKPLIDSLERARSYYKNHLLDEIETTRITDTNVQFFDENNKSLRVFGYKKNGKYHKLAGKDGIFTIKELQDMENPLDNVKVLNFIDNMMESIIADEVEYLKENGVFDTYFDRLVESKDNIFGSIDEIKNIYALNYHIGSIEQTKLFTGDLAFYKTPADVFKRMSMMNSTKNSLRTDDEILYILNEMKYKFEKGNSGEITNFIKTVTLQDVESNIKNGYTSQELDTLKKIFKDRPEFIKVYENINEGDGFAYMTIDAYKRMRIRAGNWNKSDEILYDQIAKGEYSYNLDTVHRWTMLKYQYTGKLFNPDLLEKGLNVPAGRKFAVMPLIPGLIGTNTVLGVINKQMLENGVEMAFYTSTAKFGHTVFKQPDGSMSAHKLYDENGSLNKNLDFSINHDILNWEYMGDQLKINNKPKTKVQGTQRNKLIVGNFFKNGILNVKNKELKKDIDLYQELQKTKAINSMNQLRNKIGLDELDFLDLENLTSFVDVLVEQGLSQGYSSTDIASIQNLHILQIFEALPNKNKLESLLTSTLNKSAIENKRKGDMLAQASDIGFEINDEIASLSNRHNLKFYRYAQDKNGNFKEDENSNNILLPMEIMVPLPNELIKYVIDTYSKTGYLTEESLQKFNEDIQKEREIYEKTLIETPLIKAITYSGFRTPSQDASSLDVAQVKKFFMPHMTGIVVIPKPLVTKTGSDFDIDKITFYMPNIKLIKENSSKVGSKFLKSINITKTAMTKILKDEGYDIVYDNINEKFREFILEMPESLLNNEISITINKAYNQYLKTFLDAGKIIGFEIPTGEGLLPSEMNKMQLENALLEVENKIILNPENHLKLLSPLTESTIKSIAKEIAELTSKNKLKEEFSDVFSGKTNVQKFIAFLAGKAGVGQVAVHITNHTLAQVAGLQMLSKHNYFDTTNSEYIDLGLIENKDGQNISQLLSELLTAYVDIAKDPYILELNAIKETANVVIMMVRWGIPIKDVFYFMNQPIIKDYLKFREKATSVSSLEGFGKEYKSDSINNVLRKYNSSMINEDMIYYKEEKIEEGDLNIIAPAQDLYNPITSKELKDNLSNPNNAYQVQILDLYLEYDRQSKIFQKMIRGASPDTQQFKNISILDTQIKTKEEVEASGMFKNYEKIFTDTFIGEYFNNKDVYFNAVKDLFITQHPNLKESFDNLKNIYMMVASSSDESVKFTNEIDNELINFLLPHSALNFNFNDVFDVMFKGPNSLPKNILKIKKYLKEQGIKNILFEKIEPLVNYRNQGYDSLKLSDRKLNESTRELLIDALAFFNTEENTQSLKDEVGISFKNNLTFSENIWLFNMMQSSMNNHPMSLKEIIDSKVHLNMIYLIFSNFAPGTESARRLITEYTGFNGKVMEKVGEFTANHPNPLNKRKIESLKVRWSKFADAMVLKHENGIEVEQKGSYNVKKYEGFMPSVKGKENQSSVKKNEINASNNPLNDNC